MSTEGVGEAVMYRNIILWTSSSSIPRTEGTRIWSPKVVENPVFFLNLSWHDEVPKGSIGLKCAFSNCEAPIRKYVRFGVADEIGNEINCCYGEWFENSGNGYFRVTELCKLSSWNNISTTKRIFCEVINNQDNEATNAFINKYNVYETDEVTKAVSDIEIADSPMIQELKNLRKLSTNLQELYASEKHADVIIKVKQREFKVHKAILTARSSVFDAMFTHELSESKTGLVPIEDCEPNIFEDFLFFVYTGKVQEFSAENVCELYYVADKYQVSELKEECVDFLKKSLSIESICDVICLSTKCNERDLLDSAITFFARHMEEILVTVKWQQFLKENYIVANELSIKALKLGFTKRKI